MVPMAYRTHKPPCERQKGRIEMKRDLDLIRNLLLAIEEAPSGLYLQPDDFLPVCDDLDKIVFHLELLDDAGFIESIDASTTLCDSIVVKRMTFAGCDYLDAVRNKAIWERIREKLVPFGGQVSLEIVKELGISLVKQQLMS